MTPRATVVVPTFNGGEDLRAVLAALREQEVDGEVEILVIDSGSRDGTAEFLRSQPLRLLEIPHREFNHGLTRNLGVEEARGDFVAFLTQDALPCDRTWLRPLLAAFDDPAVAGVYSLQIPRPEANPFTRFRLANWVAAQPERRVQRLEGPQELEALAPLDRLRRAAFDNVSSCVRRRVALEIPFRRRAFGEDLDWGLRAILAGHSLVFEPASKVIHSHQRSIWYEFKRVYRDHQNLHALLGVHTVPQWRHVARSTVAALPSLHQAVAADPRLGPLSRLWWRGKALPYAFTQNLAQYLGARSVGALAARNRVFAIVDRLLGAGV